jgi:hypothetical protein
MKIKNQQIFYFILLIWMTVPVHAQSRYNNIPPGLYQKANTAKSVDYMSQDEKDVVLYMNLARINGKWFVKNIIEKHSDFTQNEQKSYVKSLISDLKKTKKLTPLSPFGGSDQSGPISCKGYGTNRKNRSPFK